MSDEDARIDRLERRVDFLIRYLGINPADIRDGIMPEPDDRWPGRPGGSAAESDWLPEALYDALRRGKKIEAIKIYREVTGAGLGEAKSAVDRIVREMLGRPWQRASLRHPATVKANPACGR